MPQLSTDKSPLFCTCFACTPRFLPTRPIPSLPPPHVPTNGMTSSELNKLWIFLWVPQANNERKTGPIAIREFPTKLMTTNHLHCGISKIDKPVLASLNQ